MVVLRTIVHDEVDRLKVNGPAALLDYADARLCALGLPRHGVFVTAFSGALDTEAGEFAYSSAGHNPPRLLRARDRTIPPLNGADTTPLGMLDEPRQHTEEVIALMPDDLVVLYTGGITASRSPGGVIFDTARLDRVLHAHALPEPMTPGSVATIRAKGNCCWLQSRRIGGPNVWMIRSDEHRNQSRRKVR